MPKKILLADDSITIQKVVELTFSDGDYEVTAVNNGAKAVQKLSEMRPDIILSDIIMPEKNGYEVCEYVKSHPEYRNIPVVLLTGTFEPFDPDRADKAGCDAVVTKPFESQSLIHKVEELIDQARASAPAAAAPAASAPAPAPEPEPEPEPQFEAAPEREEASPWSEEPAVSAPPTAEMPFGQSTPSSATTQQFTPPREEEASPWANPPAGGETRAFPKMNFEDMQRLASESQPQPSFSEAEDESPFGAPPAAEQFSGETRAFPKLGFDDLKRLADEGRASHPEPEVEEEAPAFSGETRAFPQMSFEQLSQAASQSASAADDESPWGSPSAVAEPEPEPQPEPEPEPEPEPDVPVWSSPAAPAAAQEPAAAFSSVSSGNGVSLTDEQIDKIARRVVQLMSDQVVRNIAWEVIPDMAEMVVKERIRQLESES